MWKAGNLPEEIWEYRIAWIRNFILLPVIGANWEQMKSQSILSDNFVREVELEKGKELFSQVVNAEPELATKNLYSDVETCLSLKSAWALSDSTLPW